MHCYGVHVPAPKDPSPIHKPGPQIYPCVRQHAVLDCIRLTDTCTDANITVQNWQRYRLGNARWEQGTSAVRVCEANDTDAGCIGRDTGPQGRGGGKRCADVGDDDGELDEGEELHNAA